MKQSERGVAPLEEDRFGDLDLEARRSEAGFAEREDDRFMKRAAVELDGGRVDGDANMAGPARRLGAGFADDPGADLDDQAGVLGDRDELGRRHAPARRMVPAQ